MVLLASACEDDNAIDPAPDPFATDGMFEAHVENDRQIVFDSQAKASYDVIVGSNQPWKVTKNADWIEILLVDESRFTVTARKNRSIENRNGTIIVSSGNETQTFDILQTKGKVRVYTVNGDSPHGVSGIPGKAVSLNGRYVIGSYSGGTWVCDLDSVDPGDAVTMNLDISTLRFFPPVSLPYSAVSNHGELASDGITPDGRIRPGFRTASSYSTPYVIRDGWMIELDHPREIQMGTLLPHQGYYTKAISADGSYIVGKHVSYRGGLAECGWKFNEFTGKYEYIFYPEEIKLGQDEWIVNSPNPEYVSPMGKYVAGRYYPWGGNDEDGWNGSNFPYYRDLSTGKIHILKQYSGYGAVFITDEGLLGLATQLGATSIVDIKDPDTRRPLKEWIEEYYRIDPDEYGIVNGLMYYMIPEKSTLTWSYTPPGKRITWTQILTVE